MTLNITLFKVIISHMYSSNSIFLPTVTGCLAYSSKKPNLKKRVKLKVDQFFLNNGY